MTNLVKSLNIRTRKEFDELLRNARPNVKEVMGRVIFGGMTYANAGHPHNMSKQHVYYHLKNLKRRKEKHGLTNTKNIKIN